MPFYQRLGDVPRKRHVQVERKRYVTRSPHPTDGRAVLLRPTAAGERLYAMISRDLIEEEKALLRDFEPRVRKAAAEIIARLARAAETRSGLATGAACCPTK